MEVIVFLLKDLATSIVRWPLWWYTKGLVLIAGRLFDSVQNYGRTMAISVWMKNIFVPMFGYRDFQSRVISFLMRVFQICFRAFMMTIWTLLMLVLLIGYVALPIVAVFAFVFHFVGVIAG